jgi:RHH-type transcriptional regulator, proline utilization regulon repressor / proline dehydrogenase / delta 1-pyrroline-5-carboxylate dehydrogenase
MINLSSLRREIRDHHIADEASIVAQLSSQANITAPERARITSSASQLVEDIRADDQPGLMELFLAEYGLSTDEGVALMCLAEALLRVPDAKTIDDLIEDKIAPSSWGEHLGKSSSSLVNASTWALMLTGKVLDDDHPSGIASMLHGAVKRLGEPVIRTAVKRAMQEMGSQFVLGETIESAVKRGAAMERKGYSYSYDMLGEAALTARDAQEFFEAYKASITLLASRVNSEDIRQNPGISIKLSALHPRYEVGQKSRVMDELVERTLELTLMARQANMGLNIDAEEADRLDISLDIIEAVLRDERLAGWDGFGVVVQAYGKRASYVIDWLYSLSGQLSRKIMVRLVKGAYWDTEIKQAQESGLQGFPVFTSKSATDVSYICCAKKLLGMTDRIYPQFATHNAHSVAAILKLAPDHGLYEFQRLHGMGEAMHRQVLEKHGTRCRIYAPIGAHRDLLAYLVRRLLENGANSSFVNQIIDEKVPAITVAADPFKALVGELDRNAKFIKPPCNLYAPGRINSRGWNLQNEDDWKEIEAARLPLKTTGWVAKPLMAAPFTGEQPQTVTNPANPSDVIGDVIEATSSDVEAALSAARDWQDTDAAERAAILNRASDLYEENFGELFAALAREAGKNPADAIAEVREAVDFLRYYATQTVPGKDRFARGLIACISPWNFPLAIFTGQIAAALAAGNGVLAKPAEPTPITASIATKLMHDAGVPKSALQLLPGRGPVVGAKLVGDHRINGVCFTGSTATAQHINRSMAETVEPDAPLIAETGGLNAMIVDSTALPEQAVKDIIASAFQSAGQRCSALRLLYLQEDIAPVFKEMLFGAMDELVLGDPWDLSTDAGPVINQGAQSDIKAHIEIARNEGRLLKQVSAPKTGTFVGPAVLAVSGMNDMHREIFGPVLHVATFKAHEIDKIIAEINGSGYGLTFGLHTRIDDRVEQITSQLNVGNMYINRNQIGAIVGSQPFGGEGLSGTGPKAGGPNYVKHFTQQKNVASKVDTLTEKLAFEDVQAALDIVPRPQRKRLKSLELPGPTGESNRLSFFARGVVLCLGPTAEDARRQADIATSQGCTCLIVCPEASGKNALSGFLDRSLLTNLTGFNAVVLWSESIDLRKARQALAEREGPLIPLITQRDMADRCLVERHICIDTTASGGNASLLAKVG